MQPPKVTDNTLNTTYIGLEYQIAKLSRIQHNPKVWLSFLAGFFITLSVFIDAIPAIFGQNFFTALTIIFCFIMTALEMHISYMLKRNAIRFRGQRLSIELDRVFDSDDPDADSIHPSDVKHHNPVKIDVTNNSLL